MLGYVGPNIIIKVLQELCQTPLYKSVKISSRPTWQDLVELAHTNEIIELEIFFDEDCTNTLVQNILNLQHVIDNNDKSITIVLEEGFQPLGLFRDAHSKKYNCPHYFVGIQDYHLHVLNYQKIVKT
jgi:hypothetical protein